MHLKSLSSRRQICSGLLSCFVISMIMPLSSFAQESKVTDDGSVVVRKNADGSVDTFDSSDPAVSGPGGQSDKNGATSQSLRYGVHGQGKPYTRKHGDGVVVKRNSDGTIETFDTSTTYEPLYAPVKSQKVKKKKKSHTHKTVKRTSTTKSKKTSLPKGSLPKGSLLKKAK